MFKEMFDEGNGTMRQLGEIDWWIVWFIIGYWLYGSTSTLVRRRKVYETTNDTFSHTEIGPASKTFCPIQLSTLILINLLKFC